MHPLEQLLKDNEAWLMRRIRDYAVERDYSRYTSTLEEAWRLSIQELTNSIAAALTIRDEPWELGPDDSYIADPIAAFGVLEAQRHRSRGISFEMFMGLMKYYRQAYLDLIRESFPANSAPDTDTNAGSSHARFIERIFDRIEIAFSAEWSRDSSTSLAIDELRQANRLVTNEKNKFLTIFESLPTAVFLLDGEHRIVHMNHAAARMLNPAAKAGEHYYSQAQDRIAFPWLAEELSRFAGSGDETECEYLLELPHGENCQVLARFRPMEDVSLKYSGTVVILRDITQRKRAEEELKQAQAFMIQQEKMASVGQLAAGVAHEINNPMGFVLSNLAGLKNYIDSLTEFIALQDQVIDKAAGASGQLAEARKRLEIDYVCKDAKDLIAESMEGAVRVKRIVQDLKTFSRADQSEHCETDLNATLETAINIVWNEIKYVATLQRDFGKLPLITCHPQQLGQVFLNLLINAAQAMEGPGTITVRSWCDDQRACVSVIDTGCGIAPEHLPRLFEPFFTTKEVGKGTGLGLSISYGIVKSHGGEIAVKSTPGQGSTFTVSLPLQGS